MKKFICILFLTCFISGCASATVLRNGNIVNSSAKKTKTFYDFQNNFETVWKSVVKTCSAIDVSIKVIEKDSGIITAEKYLVATEDLRDTFHTGNIKLNYDIKQPAGIYGCANEAMVANRGKVVKTEERMLDLLTEFAKRSIEVAFSYNIFVEELESNKSRVKINIFAYPLAKKLRYFTAQYDARYGTNQQQYIDINISSAKFISKGKFEKDFLSLIYKNLKRAEGNVD